MKLWRCVWITARGAIADGKVTLYSHSTQQSHHGMSSTRPLKMDTYVFHTLTADLFIPQHLVIPGIQHRREMTVHLMSDVSKTLMCHSYEIIIAYWIPPASGPKVFFASSVHIWNNIFIFMNAFVLNVNLYMFLWWIYSWKVHTHTHARARAQSIVKCWGTMFSDTLQSVVMLSKKKKPSCDHAKE